MSKRHASITSLIDTMCATLAECGRIERQGRPNSFAARKSRDLRAMTEAFAITCIDEEISRLPPIACEIYSCGSLALVDHLETMTVGKRILSEIDWSRLLQAADLETIVALLDRRLSPAGCLLPMLREILSGEDRLKPLLFERIAPSTALEAMDINSILDIRFRNTSPTAVDVVADFLRIQVRHHAPAISEAVAPMISDRTDRFKVAALILAGLKPRDILEKAKSPGERGTYFLERLSSNHGLISLHEACHDLEGLLKDLSGWNDWQDQMSRDFHRIQTQ